MLRACGAAAPASVPALVRARLAKAKPTSSFAASAVASSAVSSSSTLEELAADRKGGASSSGESHVAQSRSEVRLFSPPCGSELGSHGESCLLKCPSELRIVFRATFSSSYGLPIAKQLFPEPGHLLFDTTIVAGLARVVLKKGKTQIFRDGSPMVYSGAVDRIIGRPPPKTGDVVLVADGSEKPIGWGLYNSVSMFCVRLMQLEEEAKRDPTSALNMERLLEERICSAVDLRRSLDLPSTNTNAYRLINSEGDRLSGLIVDVFADVAVIASSAAWVEKYRQQIQLLVNKVSSVNYIKWRSSTDILKEEGLDLSEQIEPAPSSHSGTVKVMENGIVYLVSVEGQKTGFYADQRESRDFISRLSKDRKVLDLCCYSGGFALSAAKGGATNVIGIDSSGSAVDLANENILLNKFDAERISFIKEDASTFMKGAISRNELWDLVVLDPPKLAPRKKVLQSASGMYRSLNALAMQVVKPGGLLMTCSCSGAMTQSGLFLKTIQGAASMAGRKVAVLRQAGAACDHPIDPSYPEGQYLSNYLLRVM